MTTLMNDHDSKTVFLFPAFGAKCLGMERELLSRSGAKTSEIFASAREFTGEDLLADALSPETSPGRELHAQYATYVYSCAFSHILEGAGFTADIIAGYSMGLYAALYHAGCFSLEQGLFLIRTAFDLALESAGGREYAMAHVAGLEYEDVSLLLGRAGGSLEIINRNNRYHVIVAGEREAVQAAALAAREEGALHVTVTGLRAPYHSAVLDEAAFRFEEILRSVPLRDPRCPVISAVDQSMVRDRSGAASLLCANLHRPLDWKSTMETLIARGIPRFIECGPGRSLDRMARFLDGNFVFDTLEDIFTGSGTRK